MDLDGLGARCALASCATLDYLPLRCTHCKRQFCADHHTHAAHACHAAPATPQIPTCPICAQPVPPAAGQSADAAMARHVDAGCPKRARENKLCAKPGCRARDVAPVVCRVCGDTFCLEHRLEADHECRSAGRVSADTPLSAAMKRLGTGGTSAPVGRSSTASAGARKKMSLPLWRRSKSPRGQAATVRGSSSTPVDGVAAPKSSAGGAKLVAFSNLPSTPKRITGAAAIDTEDALHLAVYFAPQLERRPEYWIVSRRWSAGKVLDGLNLPELDDNSRFSLYAVRRSADRVAGVNLLPRINPLREAGGNLRDGDAIVVEVGENGLPSGWMDVLERNGVLGKFKRTRAMAVDVEGGATRSKCVVV
jgi:predicted nucleic acid binding AN1-type Zn finger protein